MESVDPSKPSLLVRWLVVGALALAPCVVAVLQLGRLHPDEVFQSLEPAMHKAFGYGVLAWEWQVGLRNWATPGVFAGLLTLGSKMGIESVMGRRVLIEVPMFFLHLALLAAVFRFSSRRVGERTALYATVVVGCFTPLFHFAGRTMGESISTAFIVWGLERADAKGWKAASAGGVLLGLAVVSRYGSAVFAAGAVVWLLVARRWKDSGALAAGGLVVAAGLGALDWATWGAPFHSLRKYLDFNVFSDQAAQQFGKSPASFYAPHLLWVAPFVLAMGWWLKERALAAWGPAALALTYLAVVSATPHKEVRFLLPALVVLVVSGVPALLSFAQRWVPVAAVGIVLAVAGLALTQLPTPFAPQRPEQFRATVAAADGATGFLLVGDGMWGSGGFFYLGKNIPWTMCDFPEDPRFQGAMQAAEVNRVVTWGSVAAQELQAARFVAGERIGEATVWRR